MHPAVCLVYGLFAMVLAMAFVQPALSAIAFAGTALFGLLLCGWRAFAKRMAWQAALVAAVTLLNGLFVQRGATALLAVGPLSIHAESVAYGLCMGLSLAATLEVFVLVGELVPSDEALSLAGGRFLSTALLAAMTLRMVPRMRLMGAEYRDASAACTALRADDAEASSERRGGPVEGARKASRMLSAIFGAALEDALVTADSMRARGYGGAPARTSYSRRRFSARDALSLAAVVALGLLALACAAAGSSGFAFYPRVHGGVDLLQALPFAAFFLLPSVAYAAEAARWRRWR